MSQEQGDVRQPLSHEACRFKSGRWRFLILSPILIFRQKKEKSDNMSTAKILVNIHEPQDIIQHLQKAIAVEIKDFTPGDYLLGEIAVERKTLPDFISSWVQGRLFDQLSRLRSSYTFPFLLIEAYHPDYLSQTTAFYSILLTILLKTNVKIICTKDQKQTADVLLLMAGRAIVSAQIMRQPKKISLQQRRLNMLLQVPGMGRKKAQLLLETFGTLDALFKAESRQIQEIPTIGRKTVVQLDQILNGK